MNTIHKYTLPKVQDRRGYPFYTLQVPKGAVPLCVGVANNLTCIWFQVDTNRELAERIIHERYTGEGLSGFEGKYIGTLVHPVPGDKDFVVHFFDQLVDFSNPWEVSATEVTSLLEWESELLGEN